MRVAHEAPSRDEVAKVGCRCVRRHHVLPDRVPWTAVHSHEVVGLHPQRQLAQIVLMVVTQLSLRPSHRGSRVYVELFKSESSDSRHVVVPGNPHMVVLPGADRCIPQGQDRIPQGLPSCQIWWKPPLPLAWSITLWNASRFEWMSETIRARKGPPDTESRPDYTPFDATPSRTGIQVQTS